MRISLDWLNSYLDRPATADEVAALLTEHAFPVEGRQDLPQGDVALEVEVTSNRPDCLCHLGLAREVAVAGRRLLTPDFTSPQPRGAGSPAAELAAVELAEPEWCPVYTARVIQGVKVGPSPAWLVKRLESVGLRSVNNVVDVTNFVLLEMSQPLHAFDLHRLSGRRIVVRRARAGEPFTAIDASKHLLRDDMLVIADAVKPVAVAGVMGGLDSEVGPTTRDLLLESAQFDPLAIRRASRGLKLASDSSYRFERGVDPAGVELASRRAARLIVELAGGSIAEGVIRVGAAEPEPRVLELRPRRCRQLLGLQLKARDMVDLLERLGLQARYHKPAKVIECRVPTFRLDLVREIDLIEEVARWAGLERVRVRRKLQVVVRPVQPAVAARQKAQELLRGQGYLEAVTFSFVPPRLGEPFLPEGEQALMIDDDRRKAEPMLRPSLLPSLLSCRKLNQDAGNAEVRLTEIAAVWSRQGPEILERQKLALLADATPGVPAAELALRELRGAIEELVAAMFGPGAVLTVTPAPHPALAAAAQLAVTPPANTAEPAAAIPLGIMGLLAPATQQLFALQTPMVAAELDLPALIAAFPPARLVQAPPRFPGIERDLSVVVEEAVPWQSLREQIDQARPALLETIAFVGAYRGKPIPAGKKSVTFRMTFRDPANTLRHEQVDPQVAAVVERLRAGLQAELRA